ncbi:MAG: efflux transporter outer membrane subunit [Steroidobacteraceae bacterium]
MSISSKYSVTAALGLTLVSGCTVGPNYHGAPPVAADSVQAGSFVRAPQNAVRNGPTASAWWQGLNDAELTALIETALTHSPDLRAAQARLRQSRAGLSQAHSNTLPSGSASAAYAHADLPLGVGTFEIYNVGFDATWEADLFGGKRRAVQNASAKAEAATASLADAQVQLSAEVAQTYIDLRDQQQRIALVRKSAELEQQVLELTQQRRERGVASDLDVERVRTQLETTRESLIPLDSQITESLDQLAVLTGKAPGALDTELQQPAPLPVLPETVSIGDPASLIRQRPDIRAAEWQLVAANAQIGQRIADFFPKLTLIGDLGLNSEKPGDLFNGSSFMWLGAPLLQWNLLDFGRNKAKVEEARGDYDEAEAKYEGAVLNALRDANVALSRYGHQRDNVVSLRKVETSATHAADLTQQRYRAGTTSALDWLDAERTRFSAEQSRISGDAQLLKDYIALHKSLGLGWQTPPLAPVTAAR